MISGAELSHTELELGDGGAQGLFIQLITTQLQ